MVPQTLHDLFLVLLCEGSPPTTSVCVRPHAPLCTDQIPKPFAMFQDRVPMGSRQGSGMRKHERKRGRSVSFADWIAMPAVPELIPSGTMEQTPRHSVEGGHIYFRVSPWQSMALLPSIAALYPTEGRQRALPIIIQPMYDYGLCISKQPLKDMGQAPNRHRLPRPSNEGLALGLLTDRHHRVRS